MTCWLAAFVLVVALALPAAARELSCDGQWNDLPRTGHLLPSGKDRRTVRMMGEAPTWRAVTKAKWPVLSRLNGDLSYVCLDGNLYLVGLRQDMENNVEYRSGYGYGYGYGYMSQVMGENGPVRCQLRWNRYREKVQYRLVDGGGWLETFPEGTVK